MAKKVAVIAGGAGQVGTGICDVLRNAGYEIVVIGRRKSGEGFYQTDLCDEKATEKLAKEIQDKYGKISCFVATLGGWQHGSDILSEKNFQQYLTQSAGAHFNCLKFFLPFVENYIAINGEAVLAPMPQAGIVSVGDAAVNMLFKVVASENPGQRMVQFIICSAVDGIEMKPQEVGQEVLSYIEDQRAQKGSIKQIGVRATKLHI